MTRNKHYKGYILKNMVVNLKKISIPIFCK